MGDVEVENAEEPEFKTPAYGKFVLNCKENYSYQ